ncbi:MAG: phage tail protein [Rhodanobacter sp.]
MSGLFGSKKSASQQTKAVSALQVQTSTSGQVLPLLWGANLLAGNLAWYGNWIATPHTSSSSSGGKGGGGGGSGSTTYTYTTGAIISLCEGQIYNIGTIWDNQAQNTAASLGFTMFNGATPQTTWAWLASYDSAQAIPYNGTAYVAASALNLGSNTSLPNYNFEVLGPLAYSQGTINDAVPSDIITDYLTNATHGAGFAGYLGSTTTLRNYCLARSLFLSPIEDQQRTASSFMDDMATWCNFACVWSYKQLNLIPYGDTALSSGYGSYSPNVTPIYDLGADDFLFTGNGTNGVELDWEDIEDCYNSVAIEYNDRSQGYNTSVQNATDQADVDARGPYPMSDVQVNGITTAAVARDVAQLMLQRSLYIRKTYAFTTSMKYMLLEAMDPVTLTDPNAGLFKELVRITKVTEQDDSIDFEAEELPIGVAHAPVYDTQSPFGYSQDYNVAPGNVSPPVIFNAPALLTTSGYETWIAVAGIGQWWGGCQVWASADNLTYKQVGTISAPARYGALTAALPIGSDPDTTSTFDVALLTGQLTAGTTADADHWRQFAFVGGASGGEFIAFENATLTGTLAYSLGGYLRRGGYGSTSQAHVTGDVFARIDDGIFRLPYDSGNVGQTMYFKFVSFNTFGGGVQQLSAVTAYSHVIGASDVLAPASLFDQLAGQYATPSSGSNFIPNPSFELNNIGATGAQTIDGHPVCDSWYVYQNDAAFFYAKRDTTSPDVGTNDLSIYVSGTSVPASSAYACRVVSAPIYVAPGQLLSYSGDIRTDSAGGNGATIQWSQTVGMLFFNSTGAEVSGGDTNVGTAGVTAPTGAYANYAKNQFTVPAGASYAQAYCYLAVTNTSASVAATVASWAARFDNLNGLFVTAAGQVNYSSGATVDSLKPATANADQTSVVTTVPIINPNFDMLPAGTGWTPDAGSGWVTDMSGITPGGQPGCAKRVGGGAGTLSYRNTALFPCQPGQIVKLQALIKAIGCNGYCCPTVSFRDINGTEITSEHGLPLVTGTTTQGSFAVGAAPAGTVYAVAQLTVNGHTTGTYLVDNLATNMQPSSMDEVPDGTTRYGAISSPVIQAGLLAPGGNLVINPTAAMQNYGWPSVISGIALTPLPANTYAGGAGASSDPFWQGTTSGADHGIAQAPGSISTGAGAHYVISADMYTGGVTSGSVSVYVIFLNSGGTEITGTRFQMNAVKDALIYSPSAAS